MEFPLSFAVWAEGLSLPRAIGESMWIIATLSAIHVLGFTLSLGSALVLNARLAGAMLSRMPVRELAGPVGRGISIGLVVSIASGVLLVSWKLSMVLPGAIFQVKMVLLVTAGLLHFVWLRPCLRRAPESPALKAPAFASLALWLGLGVAGCAFILFE